MRISTQVSLFLLSGVILITGCKTHDRQQYSYSYKAKPSKYIVQKSEAIPTPSAPAPSAVTTPSAPALPTGSDVAPLESAPLAP